MTRFSTRSVAMLAAIVMIAMAARESLGDDKCVPSKFGPEDQVGALNNITAAKTLSASKLITKGKAYRLGIETNRNTPAYPPRTFGITIVQPGQAQGATIGPN